MENIRYRTEPPTEDRSTEIVQDSLYQMSPIDLIGMSVRNRQSSVVNGMIVLIAMEQATAAKDYGTAEEVAQYTHAKELAEKIQIQGLFAYIDTMQANLSLLDIKP